MGTLQVALKAISATRENKKNTTWYNYENICLEHWEENCGKILLYLEKQLKTDINDIESTICILPSFLIGSPFVDIPIWEYSDTDELMVNITYYLKALQIRHNYHDNCIYIPITAELPDSTKIPDSTEILVF